MAQELKTLTRRHELYKKYLIPVGSAMVIIGGAGILANNWMERTRPTKTSYIPHSFGAILGFSASYYFIVYLGKKIKELKIKPYKN